MRVIKFRVFDKTTKKMRIVGTNAHDCLKLNNDNNVYYYNYQTGYSSEFDFEGEGYYLMQFTGLYDKNGKEIYEGDIVKINTDCEELIGVIKFGRKEYTLSVSIHHEFYIDFENKNIEGGIYFWTKNYGIEAIGNIYENKELIGQ